MTASPGAGAAAGRREDTDLTDALRRHLADRLGQAPAIRGLTRLSGGASRDTWAFDAETTDTVSPLILRRDPPGASPEVMRRETAVLEAAHEAGIPVPRVVSTDLDGRAFGTPAVVLERIEGETLPRRILEAPEFTAVRACLAEECGRILAGIHAIPSRSVPQLAAENPLDWCERTLRDLDAHYPTFELALRWLADERPEPSTPEPVVLHGDFRLGNLMAGPDRIVTVLDWELAHLGDPLEDLAWLCTKAWRFGSGLPVAGAGEYEDLCRAYSEAAGREVLPRQLRWWEVLSTLKWGVMCLNQAALHLRGVQRSVELAAVGRRACEAEWDLLHLMYGPADLPRPGRAQPADGVGWLFDQPSGADLIGTVREFLTDQAVPAAEGRLRYLLRVAANLLQVAERERRHGTEAGENLAGLLGGLDVASPAELAERIRAGEWEVDDPRVVDAVRRGVTTKLAITNPRYLGDPFPDSGFARRSA